MLRPVLGLLAVATGVLLLALAASAEVVDRAATLPYTEERFWRVRFLGGLELKLSSMTKPAVEAVISMLLALVAGAAVVCALLVARLAPDERQLLTFFAVVAVGATVLALDELTELNESIAANLTFLDQPPFPGRARLDLLTYPPAVIAFVAVFWRILRSARRAFAVWMASVALFGVAAMLDAATDRTTLEAASKLVTAIGIATGFVLLAVDRMTALLRPLPDARDATRAPAGVGG